MCHGHPQSRRWCQLFVPASGDCPASKGYRLARLMLLAGTLADDLRFQCLVQAGQACTSAP